MALWHRYIHVIGTEAADYVAVIVDSVRAKPDWFCTTINKGTEKGGIGFANDDINNRSYVFKRKKTMQKQT